jgi:hypothetical protein
VEPEFQAGSIDFTARGYFGVADFPDGHPTDPPLLRDRPSLLWALAFRQAREGRFDLLPWLFEIYHQAHEDPLEANLDLAHLCITLLGDAGTKVAFDAIIRALHNEIEKPTNYEIILDFCDALASRGRLADVPLMVSAFESIEYVGDAAIIPRRISEMLEYPVGAITDPGNFTCLMDYREAVLERCGKVMGGLGSDEILVFGGKRFGVVPFARTFLKQLDQPRVPDFWRRKFEASTGIDCSSFYKNGELMREEARAVVKAFTESPDAWDYEDGTRYFFGNRVPG